MAENENDSEVQPSKRELRKQKKLLRKEEKKSRQLLEVSDVCKGCGHSMALDQRFCPSCGAKRLFNRLTWRNLFEDFTERFLNMEAQFPKTFFTLFRKPEEVIVGYIQGVRRKYISAFGYFAIALTLAGFYTFVVRQWFLDTLLNAQTAGAKVSAGNVSSEMIEAQMEITKGITEGILEYNTLNYFITIPLVIIMSKLVFWNYKKYNIVEHSVIHLYTFSQYAIVSMFLQLITIWNGSLYIVTSILASLGMFVYSGYVLKRVFKLDWSNFILKTGLFIIVLGVFGFIAAIISGIIMTYLFKSGALEGTEFLELIKQQAEMQKALKEAAKMAKDSIQLDSVRSLQKLAKDTLQLLAK